MVEPALSIVVPTRDRPQLLAGAVRSALAQTHADVEVIVVDDASAQPVALPDDPRLKVVRHPEARGGAAARNTGTAAARSPYVTYLDDDDTLLPEHAAVALEALTGADALPAPVAVLTGVAVVDAAGRVLETRLPPTLPRGSHFALEAAQPGCSFHVKQTLAAPRAVLLAAGGWDEAFRSRVHTELFLRLNAICSLRGLPQVTYRLLVHDGPRVSGSAELRRTSFRQLRAKHAALFASHPRGAADMLVAHARTSRLLGLPGEAAWAWRQALRADLVRGGRALAASTGAEAVRLTGRRRS